jgi:hypothetical protein
MNNVERCYENVTGLGESFWLAHGIAHKGIETAKKGLERKVVTKERKAFQP